MHTAGAILAGGRASRFGGRPKGQLYLPNGQTFVSRLLVEMKSAGLGPVVVSADENEPYADLGVPVVPDLAVSAGPLGGIEAVLAYYRASTYRDSIGAVLFLPCDLPGLTRQEIRRLLDGYRRRPDRILSAETADGARHPLCSVIPVALLDRISNAVRDGHLGIKRLWDELGAGTIRFDRLDRFFNINSKSDYDSLFKTSPSPAPPQDTTRPAE